MSNGPGGDPFETLKKKTEPTKLEEYEKGGDFLHEISFLKNDDLKNNGDSLDRNIILQQLQSRGFLVRPCLGNPSSITPRSDSDESESESESNPPAVQKQSTKIVLEEEDEEDGEEEIDMEEEDNAEKQVDLPKELRYNEEDVGQELITDENTIFIVCNGKKDQKTPGKEPSEKIPKERISEFAALAKTPEWREKLCNDYLLPFTLDEVEWQHVNHFLLAAKYRKQPYAKEFENYNKALEIVKTKKVNGEKINMDTDFKTREKQEMYHALYAKFTQHPELARILDATLDAKLYYRINKQVKEEFVELMWLRHTLRDYVRYTLKPLVEIPLPLKARINASQITKKEENENVRNVSISRFAAQLPKYEPDVMKVSSYYMNNRLEFIQKLNVMFGKLNKNNNSERDSSFDLMEHQRMVLNYIHHDRPYHGVLVFHNLGTGKSCTSIAITEGMKHEKKIIIMMPASLKTNYWSELQKCGDVLYKQNQYWEFVSVEGKPELIPILAKALTMHTEDVRKNKGAWMVNVNAEPNYKNLSPTDQQAIQSQISHMISQKYQNIHYNANNLAAKINELGKGKKNPFDHTVVVLDEAHNFVSRIVGNIRKKKKATNSIYIKMYEQMLRAKDFRIVMLSGTPIINHPQEMGVMFNLLRGGITTWTLHVKNGQSTDQTRKILDMGKCATYDFLESKHGKITITRNPYGFVNVNSVSKPQAVTRREQTTTVVANNKTKKQRGGYGEFGVKLDSRGNVDNDEFLKQVKHILKSNDMDVTKVDEKVEKCLPDDPDVFQKTFIRETTNYADLKDTTTDLLKVNTLRRRILGLTSYYRTSNEDVLPQIIKDKENIFHEVRCEMSDYQFEAYAKIRKTELDKEKKQKTLRGLNKQINNGELFNTTSTYRVFSRCCCNFAFPTPPGRPIPVGGKIKENEDVIDEADIDEEERDEDDDPDDVNDPKKKENMDYNKKIVEALGFLRENRSTVFTQENLAIYSPKMLEMLRRLKNPQNKGLHLVYSTFRTLEGIGIFQEVLHAHGYQEFKIAKKGDRWELDFFPDGRPCYALYTGKEDSEMKEIVRNVFNGDWDAPNVPDSISIKLREIASNNLFGSIIQLFMITSSGAEGINLKNTRYVHIMEPYWHNVRLEQVMGRARRIRSHDALPKEYRTVQAFLYLSVMSEKQMKDDNFKEIQVNDLSKLRDNTPITTDEFLYEISTMKQKVNNQFLQIMKETAMDCHVHIKNHKKHEKLVCFAPVSGHNTFSDYPELEKVLQEDHNEHLRKG